jgi:hypothetical protein
MGGAATKLRRDHKDAPPVFSSATRGGAPPKPQHQVAESEAGPPAFTSLEELKTRRKNSTSSHASTESKDSACSCTTTDAGTSGEAPISRVERRRPSAGSGGATTDEDEVVGAAMRRGTALGHFEMFFDDDDSFTEDKRRRSAREVLTGTEDSPLDNFLDTVNRRGSFLGVSPDDESFDKEMRGRVSERSIGGEDKEGQETVVRPLAYRLGAARFEGMLLLSGIEQSFVGAASRSPLGGLRSGYAVALYIDAVDGLKYIKPALYLPDVLGGSRRTAAQVGEERSRCTSSLSPTARTPHTHTHGTPPPPLAPRRLVPPRP